MPINKPAMSRPGGLGEKIENTAIRFLVGAYESTIGDLSDRVRQGIDNYLEAIERELTEFVQPIEEQLLADPALPPWAKNIIRKTAHPQHPVQIVAVIGAVVGILLGLVSSVLYPLAQKARQLPNKLLRPTLPDLMTTAGLLNRGMVSWDEYERIAQSLGYSDTVIQAIVPYTQLRVSPVEFIRGAFIAGLSNEEVRAYLKELGYRDTEIDVLLTIYQLRPGPSDLVRFSVREVWRDDVAAKWGYDADFPARYEEEMRRAGDMEGWARAYWRAHWELPGITLALEMLHRGVITEEEFDEYLRVADYPAGWRERIKAVAYEPYTRVDTRRMYRFGVLDENGVYRTYRDLGYDHEHAVAMTQFTVLDALEEERELTKTDVLRAYKLGRFNRQQAKEALIDIGYNATVAETLLLNQDQQLEEERIDNVVKHTHSLYIRGGLTRSDVITRLAALNLGSDEIDRYLELWDLEREARKAIPSRTSLDEFLKEDIITVEEYREGLKALGYDDQAIAWYTQAILLDKQRLAEKEADRAADEAEKTAKRAAATEYQKQKAALTVELRRVEARIGELQNAIEARRLQYQRDLALARKRIDVEQVTSEYQQQRSEVQQLIDELNIDNRHHREAIEELQTAIAQARLELEGVIDEALKDEAKRQIAVLKQQIEAVQTIIAQGKAEIARLEEEITELIDPTFTRATQREIESIKRQIEERQDIIASYTVRQAEIARLLLDAGPDEVRALKEELLDLQIAIAREQEAIDNYQTLIAELREANVDPALAAELHTREELIAEIRTINAEAQAHVQELNERIADIRLHQIDPERTAEVQRLREHILTLRAEIEEHEDEIAANNAAIAEYKARLNRLYEDYQQSLRDLRRVESVDKVEASYRADIQRLQGELAQARAAKNELRIRLAEVRYEYIT